MTLSAAGRRRKGDRFEYLTADLLRMEGYFVMRSAGSLGSFDLAALKAGETPLLIQVKSGARAPFARFGPEAREALRRDAIRAGAIPVLYFWRDGSRTADVLYEDQWPQPTTEYIVDSASGCWLWQKARHPNGYGQVKVAGKTTAAHRMMWERHRGPISPGLFLDHLCETKPCVNPDHLEPVTQAENNRRGPLARLTPSQVLAIRRDGRPTLEIAAAYGVGRGQVWRIKTRQAWADLEEPA